MKKTQRTLLWLPLALLGLMALALSAYAAGGGRVERSTDALDDFVQGAMAGAARLDSLSSTDGLTQTLFLLLVAKDYGGIDITQLVETDDDFLGISDLVPSPYADVMAAGARVVNLEPLDTFSSCGFPLAMKRWRPGG